MKIVKHKLQDDQGNPIRYKRSANIGGQLVPEYLVIHYTEGATSAGAVDWLTRRDSQVSAHLVIARDGKIIQLVPFNRVAYHAGPSKWEGRVGLNNCSIGIELDNPGRLIKHGDRWRAGFGREYESEDVIEAVHKHGRVSYGWHIFPEDQISALREVGICIMNKYGLIDVVGHDDISPGRKWDPGPAFPMESIRSQLVSHTEDELPRYELSRSRYLYSEPGRLDAQLPGRPLPKGTKVEIINEFAGWREVDVIDENEGIDNFHGWLHVRDLNRLGG